MTSGIRGSGISTKKRNDYQFWKDSGICVRCHIYPCAESKTGSGKKASRCESCILKYKVKDNPSGLRGKKPQPWCYKHGDPIDKDVVFSSGRIQYVCKVCRSSYLKQRANRKKENKGKCDSSDEKKDPSTLDRP